MEIKKGDEFEHYGSGAKVMAVVDNWIMARKKGCVPFIINISDRVLLIF